LSYTREGRSVAFAFGGPATPVASGHHDQEQQVSKFKDRTRVVGEFRADEYDKVRDLLFGRLERRLSRWDPEQVELELSVKERDTPSQKTVLECWIAGAPRVVGTSKEQDLDKAVVEVRDDVWRQVDRYVTRQEASRAR
jgi:ribosome-associated translation inhibitor RaiA